MKKILIVGLTLIGLVGTGWVFAERVLATEAVDVFDEACEERQQERQTQMEAKLDEAVGDGVITAEQKQALLDKRAEMQQEREQKREETKTWREESGIDFEALAPYKSGYGGKGFGPGPGKMHSGFGGF